MSHDRHAVLDFRGELNDEQFSAVTAPPGPALVLAGAGSGKTRTLTYRVAYLLSEGAKASEILLLTFTNKAAKEMLHRVTQLTTVPAHRFWGGTFHSIGHRILRIHGQRVGLPAEFTILAADESEDFLRDTVKVHAPGFFKDPKNPKPRVLHEIVSFARNTRMEITAAIEKVFPQHKEYSTEIAGFAERYRVRKVKHAMVDYDDLLEYWHQLLVTAPDVARGFNERFNHILVDEYQDTNALQSRIVDLMAPRHQIMAVGDDAQCIYTWRGAEVTNILTFPERHPNTKIFRIETNYRSTPQILDFANDVLRARPKGTHFEKALIPARDPGEQPFLASFADTVQQATFVCQRIRALVEEGHSLSSIAVLYRAHHHSLDVQIELARASLPYAITSGVKFFEQAHIRDAVAVLRFCYNPGDIASWRRVAILLPKIGEKNADHLYELAHQCAGGDIRLVLDALMSSTVLTKVPVGAREEWPQLLAALREVDGAVQNCAPKDAVEAVTVGWYADYLKAEYPNFQARLDDLQSLVGFAARFTEMEELLAQISLFSAEPEETEDGTPVDLIRLTTVHQAKGLEFNTVFLIGLGDGQFPLTRAIESGELEEERRLFYVAVTRAKDALYLCYPKLNAKGNGGPMEISRFISEAPPSHYQPLKLDRNWAW